MEVMIRHLAAEDNEAAARVIRAVMPEFGCVGEGYSIQDPEMNDLHATYSLPRSGYFVAELLGADAGAEITGKEQSKGKIVATAGYAPLTGGPPDTCELRKMYALPEARGLGLGRELLAVCIAGARRAGFRVMYLETVTAMTAAAAFYQRHGFVYIDGPLGATGHSGCDLFMSLEL